MSATSHTKPNGFRYYELADAIAASKRVNSTAKLVAYRLARHANGEDGTCNPRVATIAKELALSKRAVEDALRNLVNAGCLLIDHGKGNRSSYYLTEPPAEPRETVVLDTPAGTTRDRGSRTTRDRGSYVNSEVELPSTASQHDTDVSTATAGTEGMTPQQVLDRYVEIVSEHRNGRKPKITPDDLPVAQKLYEEHGAQIGEVLRWALADKHAPNAKGWTGWHRIMDKSFAKFAEKYDAIREQWEQAVEPERDSFHERVYEGTELAVAA